MFQILAVVIVLAAVLTEQQLLIVGAVVNVVLWLLRIILAQVGKYPPREVLVGVITVVSIILGVAFTSLEYPTGGLEEWIQFLFQAITPILGTAWAVYQIIGKRVFDGIADRANALAFRN